MKGYFMVKNSFVAEVTFKIQKLAWIALFISKKQCELQIHKLQSANIQVTVFNWQVQFETLGSRLSCVCNILRSS